MLKKFQFPLKKLLCSCFLILSLNQVLFSQNPIVANASLAEKIYLQLDRNVYLTNETIWFKSILLSAATHKPNTLSGVLHVELIGPNEQVVEKKLVELKDGFGDNFFELYEHYAAGKYLIRAYTEWNKNFSTDFIFHTYIDIFPSSPKNLKQVIRDIYLKENSNGFKLTAHLDPLPIDSLQQEELHVFLALDKKRDTLTINKNTEGRYDLEYEIPQKPGLVTISIETSAGFTHSRTVAPGKGVQDIQFLPESGELIHGMTNLVGFKALDYGGRGTPVEGEIVNSSGKLVTTFKSNHLGMGKFYIRPDSSSVYSARIFSTSEQPEPVEFHLPPVTGRGSSLSVIQRNDLINLMVSSNVGKEDSIYIQASCRGVAQYFIPGKLTEGQAAFSVSGKGLPEGIIAFTLFNSKMRPTAERLFFNELSENKLNLKISTDKEVYSQREQTKVNLKVTNGQGEATKANISVLVLAQSETGSTQNRRQNILSEILLNSELRGEIEDAGYYFRPGNNNRQSDLDALLLTQGWRRYNYNEPPKDSLYFEPEITLNVTGTVGGILSKNKKKEGIGISLMTFGPEPSVSVQETDSLGRFYFPVRDERGQRLNILIQSTNKSGRNRNYTISLKEPSRPTTVFDHRKAIKEYESAVQAFVQKQQSQQLYDDLELPPDMNQLDEVVVDSYQMTPARKKVMDAYGKPDSVIEGHQIQEKEQSWSYGLYSVIAANFPKDIRLSRVGGASGYMKAEVVGGDETLVLVDGIPIREEDFPLIPNIPTSEVKSVEILRHVQNFHVLYRQVYPVEYNTVPPIWGSIIAIYTDGGTGILGANKPVGVVKTTVPVFSPNREFYAPKYENQASKNQEKSDLRTTIHWAPQVEMDGSDDSTSISFYNPDTIGPVLILIEAVSEDGEIGYREIEYKIEKD